MAGLICWLKLIMMNTRMNLGRVLSNFAVIRKFSNGWSNRILDNEDILYQNLYIYIYLNRLNEKKQLVTMVIRIIYLILKKKIVH